MQPDILSPKGKVQILVRQFMKVVITVSRDGDYPVPARLSKMQVLHLSYRIFIKEDLYD